MISLVLAGCSHALVAPRPSADPKPVVVAPLFDGDHTADDIPRLLRAHYTKYEARVPMRDGVRLYTSYFVPKDRSRTYPILLNRTPYSVGPYGLDARGKRTAPSVEFVRAGYVFAQQDVRGRYMSEGTFVDVRPVVQPKRGTQAIDETSDAYDTVEWLVRNVPANNGKVGLYGISYPGFYAAMGAIDAHPAVKAVSPQAPIADWFVGDDFHHNGAFLLADGFHFYAYFSQPRERLTKKHPPEWDEYDTKDGYDFYLNLGPLPNANAKYFHGKLPLWNDMMAHGTYDDFWRSRNILPHLKNIRPEVLTVGGWYDAEDLYGPLAIHSAIRKQSPASGATLVMGPWSHGGWERSDGDKLGEVDFHQKTSVYFQNKIHLPFFERLLKGDGKGKPAPGLRAHMFETGVNRWSTFDDWPPRGVRPTPLYASAGQALSPSIPKAQEGPIAREFLPRTETYDAYVSDPSKPVPVREKQGVRMEREYMIDDQRIAGRRTDVLTYATGTLEEDLTLSGPVTADLYVSTTGTDVDCFVKLVDVHPGDAADPEPNPHGVRMAGRQELVRWEVMRGKFRESLSRPVPFEPNTPTRVRFDLRDVFHTFRRGHKLMIHVQSSWFPVVDRNPQTFVDIYRASESDFRTSIVRIHRSKEHPSQVVLPILRGSLAPAP